VYADRPGIPQVHEQVPGLLDDPGLDRVLRGVQDPDAPAAVLDHRKDVHLRVIEQVSGEEVQRQDPLRPERPRRDSRAQRRRTMSRCHRKIVAGVTISRVAASRSAGSIPASGASHARSGHVNRE
jgi:hypothetical protein